MFFDKFSRGIVATEIQWRNTLRSGSDLCLRILPRRANSIRLGKLFGDGAGVWVRMQAAYDTWNAEREEDVSKIPTLRA